MKLTTQFLLSAAVLCLFSCSENDKSSAETENTSGNSPETVSSTSASDGLNHPLPSMPTAEATAGGNLNPEHGQPGHRCDIEVGAPLSSAPSQPATVTSAPAPDNTPKPTVMTMPSATPPPVQSTAGSGKINPAHGEPGHDCTKPVGQPL